MFRTGRIIVASIALALVVSACGGAAESGSPAPSAAVTPSPIATTAPTPPPASAAPSAPPSPERTALPSILPGEAWIAFQTMSASGYGVHLVRPDGTGFHRWPSGIPGTQEHPDWSPDGSRILLNTVDPDGTEDLWTANADGSDRTRIVDCVTPCLWADEAAWSPDGLMIAFQRGAMADGELRSTLEILDLAAGDVRVVLTMPTKQVLLAPRWAADGKRLAVEVIHLPEATAEAEPDGGAIGVVDLDASTPKVTLLTDLDSFANNPDWSPTEDLILFSQPAGVDRSLADLAVVSPDGTGLRTVTALVDKGGAAIHPAFTPDGTRILFLLTRAGKHETVMAVVDLDGSDLGPATGPDYRDGFHPRLRPTP